MYFLLRFWDEIDERFTADEAEPLLDFEWGVSPFTGESELP